LLYPVLGFEYLPISYFNPQDPPLWALRGEKALLLAAGNGAAADDQLQNKIRGCSAVGPLQGPGDGHTDPESS